MLGQRFDSDQLFGYFYGANVAMEPRTWLGVVLANRLRTDEGRDNVIRLTKAADGLREWIWVSEGMRESRLPVRTKPSTLASPGRVFVVGGESRLAFGQVQLDQLHHILGRFQAGRQSADTLHLHLSCQAFPLR